jgi:TonB family protein
VHPLLDRAAQQAARLCRFTPAKQREIPVKAWLAVPYVFRLR